MNNKKTSYKFHDRKLNLNEDGMDWDKNVPEVNIMMCREIQDMCIQLLEIVGHDIPITCEKSGDDWFYNQWYEKISQKEKERHYENQ